MPSHAARRYSLSSSDGESSDASSSRSSSPDRRFSLPRGADNRGQVDEEYSMRKKLKDTHTKMKAKSKERKARRAKEEPYLTVDERLAVAEMNAGPPTAKSKFKDALFTAGAIAFFIGHARGYLSASSDSSDADSSTRSSSPNRAFSLPRGGEPRASCASADEEHSMKKLRRKLKGRKGKKWEERRDVGQTRVQYKESENDEVQGFLDKEAKRSLWGHLILGGVFLIGLLILFLWLFGVIKF
ncbi:hypothetical protein JCM6882_000967 [Rhodosporidiobolus microsporus]